MIAARTGTARTHVVQERRARPDDARGLLRELFRTTADLIREREQATLMVWLPPLSSRPQDVALRQWAAELTETETMLPRHRSAPDRRASRLTLNPRDQEF